MAVTATALLYADDGESLRRKSYPLNEILSITPVGERRFEVRAPPDAAL